MPTQNLTGCAPHIVAAFVLLLVFFNIPIGADRFHMALWAKMVITTVLALSIALFIYRLAPQPMGDVRSAISLPGLL